MCLQSSRAFQSSPALSPATLYLGDHWRSGVTTLWPQRPGMSCGFLPSATSAPLCSRQPSPRVPGAMLPRSWVPQLLPGVGCATHPRGTGNGAGGSFRQISSSPELRSPAHRTGGQYRSHSCLTPIPSNHQCTVPVLIWFS